MHTSKDVINDLSDLFQIKPVNQKEITVKCLRKNDRSSIWTIRHLSTESSNVILKYHYRQPQNTYKEFNLLTLLENHFSFKKNLGVPKPISFDRQKKCCVMEQVEGKKLSSILKGWDAVWPRQYKILRALTLTGEWLKQAQFMPIDQSFSVYDTKRVNWENLFRKCQKKGLDQGFKKEIKNIIESCKFKNNPEQFVYCHRDFTPWNMIYNQGKLYVFDLELNSISFPEYDPSKFYTLLAASNYFVIKGEKLQSYREAFLKGFDKEMASNRWYYWRIIHLLSLIAKVRLNGPLKTKLMSRILLKRYFDDLNLCIKSFNQGKPLG